MAADGAVHTAPDVCRLAPRLADEVAFRDGLAKLAAGVAVVTCRTDAGPQGLLVSSLTGLSTQPPRLLFCVRKAASAHTTLLQAEAIGVSLLGDADVAEAQRFSGSSLAAERFADGGWTEAGPPLRAGALATFTGLVHCRIDAGTHTVFILDVTRAEARDGDPLVYFEREFRSLA